MTNKIADCLPWDNTIHRTDKSEASGNTFTRIDNRLLRDTSLSPEARLAMMYLLSKPDDWELLNGDLGRYLRTGKNKTQSIVTELKKAGYIVRRQVRNDMGQWETTTPYIFEIPELNTVTREPGTGNGAPDTISPVTGHRIPGDTITTDAITTDLLTTDVITIEGGTQADACITHASITSSSLTGNGAINGNGKSSNEVPPIDKLTELLRTTTISRSERTAGITAKSLLSEYSFEAIQAAVILAIDAGKPEVKYVRGILKNKAAAVENNSPEAIFRRELNIKGHIKPVILEWCEQEATYTDYTPELLKATCRYVDKGGDYDGYSVHNVEDFESASWDMRAITNINWTQPKQTDGSLIVDDIKITRRAGDVIPWHRAAGKTQEQAVKLIKQKMVKDGNELFNYSKAVIDTYKGRDNPE